MESGSWYHPPVMQSSNNSRAFIKICSGEVKASPELFNPSFCFFALWIDIPNDISICVSGKKPFAGIQQNQWVAPGVCDHDAATDLDIEWGNDHFAASLLDELGCLLRRIDEQVDLLSLVFGLQDEF